MLRRFAFILPVLLISAFLLVSLLPKPATSADGSLGYRSFKDGSTGSMLTIALQDAGANLGKFQFGVLGAGLFWPRDRATVTVQGDSSVVVGYDGPGFADPHAVIDTAFGYHQRSGEHLPVTVRLEAQVNPDGITASARLWVDGVLYALDDQRPTLDADADLLSILDAFQAQDWAAVYSWTYSGVRSGMTETDFITASTQAFSADGTVVHATRTGPVSYSMTSAGFDTATARVTLTMSSGRIVNADASLIWEVDHWALMSIAPRLSDTTLNGLSDAHLWLGLRSSDDQGTQVDVKVELYRNAETTPLVSGLTRCVTALTRNQLLASDVIVPWDPFSPISLSSGDKLTVKVSTRIGTTPIGTKCSGPGGSHNTATGVRFYYDAVNRTSRFDTTFGSANQDIYFHSDGTGCDKPSPTRESQGVTGRFLDAGSPTATLVKCKDSGKLNFNGGNPYAEVGTWTLP